MDIFVVVVSNDIDDGNHLSNDNVWARKKIVSTENNLRKYEKNYSNQESITFQLFGIFCFPPDSTYTKR